MLSDLTPWTFIAVIAKVYVFHEQLTLGHLSVSVSMYVKSGYHLVLLLKSSVP